MFTTGPTVPKTLRSFLLPLACLLLLPGLAGAMDAEAIIGRVEDNLTGKSAIMTFTMVVHNSRSERTMKMESYSVGKKKSFIKILYPGKDKGITFLKIDDSMWQYVPRIEKTIKIPASMMLQSWMGSDFTNDDLVRESSLQDDYTPGLLQETPTNYQLELHPHEDAAVVWGRIVMSVSKQYFLPVTVSYYDEDDVLVRVLDYMEVKQYGNRFYPSHWLMSPKEEGKEGNQTEIMVNEAAFDTAIDPDYFSKRALKRFSQ